MIPIKQTVLGRGGNCFAACIASIMELELENVPNFCTNENWREETNKWLSTFGFFYMDFHLAGDLRDELCQYWGYHIIAGDSPRGLRHATVGYRGHIYHDPHPDNNGLVSGDWEYGFIIPRIPRGT